MQLTSVITAPTERSSPPASTGTVCAIATMIRARLSLAVLDQHGRAEALAGAGTL